MIQQLQVNFEQKIGAIKPMHAVGQPPWLGPDGSYLHYLTEAHIPYSRLHDMGGAYGGMVYVDIPNVFPCFDADETDPASYDFAFTDILIQKLLDHGVEPIYRLGVTIENYCEIRRYRTFVPKDFDKWARICEHVIRHYIDGWANGFTYRIKYWEIWNEPDNNIAEREKNPMWSGSPEQFYALYTTTAKHLKSCFGDRIKIGGYAACQFAAVLAEPRKYGLDADVLCTDPVITSPQYQGFISFFYGFLDYIRAHRAPMDFFSWHSYLSVSHTLVLEQFIAKTLSDYGYGQVETMMNEWNNIPQNEYRGSSYASAGAAEMMLRMQRTHTNLLCYYDARIGTSMYGGLFHPLTREPFCIYYSFKAFGELYVLGREVSCTCGNLPAVAATDEAAKRRAVMLANPTSEAQLIQGIPAGMTGYLIDAEHLMTEVVLEDDTLLLQPNQVLLLKCGEDAGA